MPQSHQGQEVPSHHFQGSPSPEGQAVPARAARPSSHVRLCRDGWSPAAKPPRSQLGLLQGPCRSPGCFSGTSDPMLVQGATLTGFNTPSAASRSSPGVSSSNRHPALWFLDLGPCADAGWCPSPSEFSDFLETRCLCQPTSELYNVHPLLFSNTSAATGGSNNSKENI